MAGRAVRSGLVMAIVAYAGAAGAQFPRGDPLAPHSSAGYRDIAAALVRAGHWPGPRPGLIQSFSIKGAVAKLGLKPAPEPRRIPGAAPLWAATVDDHRYERVRFRVVLFRDALDARALFLRDFILSTTSVPVAVGRAAGRKPEPDKTVWAGHNAMVLVHRPPAAGEVCTVPDTGDNPSGMIALVRQNVAVRIHAQPVIDGQRQLPDKGTAARLVALARALDGLLMAASRAQEPGEVEVPHIRSMLVGPPAPTVGQPFVVAARVLVRGEPPAAEALRVRWDLAHEERLRKGVVYPDSASKRLGPARMQFVVDAPGWWVLTCHATSLGVAQAQRSVRLYVLAAAAPEG